MSENDGVAIKRIDILNRLRTEAERQSIPPDQPVYSMNRSAVNCQRYRGHRTLEGSRHFFRFHDREDNLIRGVFWQDSIQDLLRMFPEMTMGELFAYARGKT